MQDSYLFNRSGISCSSIEAVPFFGFSNEYD